ncbi:MAG: GNAT family N-acetyltransferase [Acidimicrobiales bacterium]
MEIPLPEPPLAGGGLRLRPWRPVDATALADAWADPEIRRFTAVPATPTVAYAQRWIAGWEARRRRGLALDLVVGPADGLAVWGEVGLFGFTQGAGGAEAEIGWWTAPGRRSLGIAGRAVALVAAWACGPLGLATLVAELDAANPASRRVAEKAGFAPAAPAPARERWVRCAQPG